MKSRAVWRWTVGLVAITAWIAFALLTGWERAKERPEPVVLWSGYSSDGEMLEATQEIRVLEEVLREIVFSVDFDDKPLGECLGFINRKLEDESGREPIHFKIDPGISTETPITLRLQRVPLAEILRYTTALSQCKYRVLADRTIEIVTFGAPEVDDEGWFQTYPIFFTVPENTKGPIDVQSQLESAGISFRDGDVAEYYPTRELLWVENTRDQMELIDAYLDSACFLPSPTWKDRVYDIWWTWTESWRVPTPASVPAPSVPTSPAASSPFGSPSTEPDPFGGPGSGSSLSFP